jgi:TPR repeat protein
MEFKKSCPVCDTPHNKRGPFCSKVCSNKARVVKPSTRRKISAANVRRAQTEAGRASNWTYLERGKLAVKAKNLKVAPDEFEFNPENLYLPPVTDETPDGAFSDGKDLWFES